MSIDSGNTNNGTSTPRLALAIATTIVGVLAAIGLIAATYITIITAGRRGNSAWAGYAVGLTCTTLIVFAVLLTHYLRHRTVTRNHERLRDDLRQLVATAQVELMSAFAEILTQGQAVAARTRDSERTLGTLVNATRYMGDHVAQLNNQHERLAVAVAKAMADLEQRLVERVAERLTATDDLVRRLLVRVDQAAETQQKGMGELTDQQRILAERQKGLTEALSRALTDLSMQLGASVAELGQRLIDQLAVAVGELAEGQKAILAQQHALADNQRAFAEQQRAFAERQVAAEEARQKRTDELVAQALADVGAQINMAIEAAIQGATEAADQERVELRQVLNEMNRRLGRIESQLPGVKQGTNGKTMAVRADDMDDVAIRNYLAGLWDREQGANGENPTDRP